MGYKITEIEGIGPAFAEKLGGAGIATTDDLLKAAADKKSRADLAEKVGLGAAQILKWANMADLMRLSGVGEEYSELLEAAGVDTVKELKMRVPANLAAKMAQLNEAKKLVRQVPGESQVAKWVEEAKSLPAIITH